MAAWRERNRAEREEREAAESAHRAQQANEEAARAARVASGEERRRTLLDMLNGVGARPFGSSRRPALDGFPVDRLPTPPAALAAAEAGDFRAAEAWGQEIAAQGDLPERERSFGWTTIQRARAARAMPRGA